MKYLKIQNSGELDVRLISLMGGTTKKDNEYKIGKFGTGLKYTLAYLIRNNIDFKIFVGEREVKITTVAEEIRDTKFDILYIDGVRSSVTSNMGYDWKGWTIIRELWCNALDEGNAVRDITADLVGAAGTTTFYLQLTGEIQATLDNWNHYFIYDTEPIYVNEEKKFAVYPPSDKLRIYKNGVLIHEEENKQGVFSYDLKTASINELREYKGYVEMDLYEVISNLDKKCIEIFLNNINSKCFEHDMSYSWYGEFGSEWGEAIGQARIISRDDLKSLQSRGADIKEDEFVVLPKSLADKLCNRFPSVSAVRRSERIQAFWETSDQDLEFKIKQALVILETCNYEIMPEVKFLYGIFGNPEVFGRVNLDTKEIMLSVELKRKPLREIVSVVIEENEHLRTGFGDLTRSFQTHFINLFTRELLERNEVKM